MAKRVDYSVLREISNSSEASGSSDTNSSINIKSISDRGSHAFAKDNMNSLYSTAWETKRASTSSSLSSEAAAANKNCKTSAPNSPQKPNPNLPIEDEDENENEDENEDEGEDEDENDFVRGRPSACVFVASLRSTMTDDDLCISVTDHFQKWGPLATVKVLRDTSNRPYAFVQYLKEEDSKLAIEMGHNSLLNGRNIRCEAAKVNRTLFFTAKSFVSEEYIRKILDRFGEIEELVPSNSRGQIFSDFSSTSRGHKNWYCKFVYRDDAIKAFASLTEEGVYKIDWAQNIDKSNQASDNSDADSKVEIKVKFDKFSVFVGQLSPDVSEAELRKRFERHGEITNLNLVKKVNNTFAFISFKNESSAASSVEAENHSMLSGKTMHVQYREVQVRTKTTKNFSVALAPPPINLGKRSSIKMNNEGSKTDFRPFGNNKSKLSNHTSSSSSSTTTTTAAAATTTGFRGKTGRFFRGRSESENAIDLEDRATSVKSDYTWSASKLDLKDETTRSQFASPSKLDSEIRPMVQHNLASSSDEPNNAQQRTRKEKELIVGSPLPDDRVPMVNSNYVAPPNSGFPLFYYVPAENVNFASSNANSTQAPFYGVYPPYYPHQSQFENVINVGGTNDYKSMNSVPPPPPPPNFGVPNFIYYANEAEIATRNTTINTPTTTTNNNNSNNNNNNNSNKKA
ncbi:hypothetical protein KGF56_001557 [Candida oxycetoniae]|uniref:RRM domain-containing protein n=1 Tax=Candida oxycetoniae TaxID=497107 RepID=A0AAI9SZ13_9ASCO|nr:uncharacterized protein KGF56_001557 [Candida oxycetoniae]KAI3405539.2 hypothetical protein KGF56_001557 [Candida oxycetoniae]